MLLAATLIFLLKSCASIKPPTGGPKDEEPPELVLSSPRNGATEFRGQIIELVFNENVALNNLNQQLLVAPYLGRNTFKSTVKKNKVTLTFNEPFPPNTTVQLNFREGIKDLTEGNKAENLTLAFSTGPYLDTAYIAGEVSQWFTEQPAAEVSVLLYDVEDTSSIYKGQPLYLTKSNEAGEYRLSNLPQGRYLIYALQDKNQNLRYDAGEIIGFITDTLTLDSTLNVPLGLRVNDDIAPKLEEAKIVDDWQSEIIFSEGLPQLNIQLLSDPSQQVYAAVAEEPNKIIVYNTIAAYGDTLLYKITALDSAGNALPDTMSEVKVPFALPADTVAPAPAYTHKADKPLPPGKPLVLSFDYPVIQVADSAFITATDTTNFVVLTDYELNQKNFLSLKLTVPAVEEETRRQLIVKREAFTTPDGYCFPLDNDTLHLTRPDDTKLGILRGEVVSAVDSFVVHLLNEKYEIVETSTSRSFSFTYLPPGKYLLRLIIDQNNNGYWDKGSLEQNKQAEPVILLKDPIQLKQNWEQEGFKL